MPNKLAVIAIGGNSLIKDDKHVTVESQYQAAKETCIHIADMIEQGWDVAIGHGNGPQVGYILRRSEIAAKTAGMRRRHARRDRLCSSAEPAKYSISARHQEKSGYCYHPGARG